MVAFPVGSRIGDGLERLNSWNRPMSCIRSSAFASWSSPTSAIQESAAQPWCNAEGDPAAMDRMRLIFFVAADPAAHGTPVASAYRFARAAAATGLEAEVRLAGDAVLVADPVYVATLGDSETLREHVDRAPTSHVDVSVCPRSTAARGIRDDQLAAIGARPRPLSEILVEVAEGRSVLVHL